MDSQKLTTSPATDLPADASVAAAAQHLLVAVVDECQMACRTTSTTARTQVVRLPGEARADATAMVGALESILARMETEARR